MKIIKSGLAFALSLTVAVAGCTVEDPEVLDTHSGEWETIPLPNYDVAPAEPQSFAPYCIPPLDTDADVCNSGQALYNEPAGPPEPGWQCDGQPCTDEQLQHLVKTLEVVGGGN